jgi:hypothetical protein
MSIEPPSLEEITAKWQEADREQRFWQEHYQEFLSTYPDQFVAVHDGQVVAVSDHLWDLSDSLERLHLKPKDVWVQFFSTAPLPHRHRLDANGSSFLSG